MDTFEIVNLHPDAKLRMKIISRIDQTFQQQPSPRFGHGLILIIDDPCPSNPFIFVEFHTETGRNGCYTVKSEGKLIIEVHDIGETFDFEADDVFGVFSLKEDKYILMKEIYDQ